MHAVDAVTITQVDEERWRAAQSFEWSWASGEAVTGDDWNEWWAERFDGYAALRGRRFRSLLEVGCGPATNVRLLLPHVTVDHLFLEDPLIQAYLPLAYRTGPRWNRKTVRPPLWHLVTDRSRDVDISSSRLEKLPYGDATMDGVLCVNVLDHVQDAERCLAEIRRVLVPGGVVVMGQDLSNEEDFERAPEAWEDVGHPIKLDEAVLDGLLGSVEPLFRKVLPRGEGRNPAAHYATYLLIAEIVK
jgi:SAM-dependent methyltransferase